MEDNNNKLSRFIKNRLQAVKGTNDSWDKPDDDVWENAKSQFTPLQKDRKRILPFWFYGLCLGVLFLLSLFYNWHLVQLKNQVKEQLEEQSEIVSHLQEQVSEGIKKQQVQTEQKVNTIEKLQFDNARLLREKEQTNEKWKQTQRQYHALLNTYHVLNSERALLRREKMLSIEKSRLAKNENVIEKSARDNKIELTHLPSKLIFVQPNLEPLYLGLPKMKTAAIDKKEQQGKVEIGLHYGLSVLKVPSIIDFNKDKKSLDQTNEVYAPMYYLHVAYSLKKNWWFKTGVSHSNYFHANSFQFKTEYDKSKEFEKPDGTLANELPLHTSNGYFSTTQNIEVNIPDDVALETGNWIFGEFEETQRIRAWQVPLGIEYRQRNNKFGWQIGASALLNMMTFSDTELEGKIQSTQNEFPTKIVNKQYDSSTTKLLLGAQGDIGLHYQLSRKLTLRADVVFQYNPYFLSHNIQMGLGYQF